MSDKIPVAAVVQQLRHELAKAVAEAGEAAIRFELQEVELELQVVVTDEATAEAGIGFWVFKAGIGDRAERSQVQKITLKLKPHLREGGAVDLSG